jgi:thiol-disulfide isomerase/thioredoxin
MQLRQILIVSAIGLIALMSVDARADMTGQDRAAAAGRGLVGTAAPKIVVKTIEGETIDLGSLYGKKAVYLKFWATWCTPCREQMPHFEHTYETAGPDLAVIAVNVGFNESLEEIQRSRRQLGMTMPIVLDDGRLGAAFRLRVTPQHIVIGRDGRVQYVGHLADRQLDAALLAARTAAPKMAAIGGVGLQPPIDTPHFDVGDPLPAKSVMTVDGHSFQFQNHGAPRPTVFVFLSPWCESYLATTRPAISASCRNTREQVTALASDRKVRWLGVASGLWATPEDLRAYQAEYKVGIPLTLDESGALFRAFRVTNVPTVLVADGRGKIARRVELNDTQSLRKTIEAL